MHVRIIPSSVSMLTIARSQLSRKFHMCALLPMQIKQSVQEFVKTISGAKDELKSCDEGVYYLVNPSGEFVKAFGHEKTAEEIGLAVVSCRSPIPSPSLLLASSACTILF